MPALPERVDPDRWLTILDHQAYLRRVGRDGCESARSGYLLYRSAIGGMSGPRGRVDAKGAQFVVWHADQIIKKLLIKGLVGQEMTIDDYLNYIRAEALAYERRSSTRSSGWGLRQPSLW